MATILCIETATTSCSVAISKNGKLIDLLEDTSKQYSHAEKLHVFINDILKKNNLEPKNLDAVAVSKGPGSYTGLRIGVSTAKGLCFALDLPLISIPTMQSLARKVNEPGIIIPMLDARRMEVYSAVFQSDFTQIRDTKAEILDEQSFLNYLENSKVNFIGDGVSKFKEICHHQNASFIEAELPSAAQMAELAEEKFKKSDLEDVAYFEPYYLKDFIAG